MNKNFVILSIVAGLFACQPSATATEEQASSSEAALEEQSVDALIEEMDSTLMDMNKQSEESLQEIDSLLNSI